MGDGAAQGDVMSGEEADARRRGRVGRVERLRSSARVGDAT